MAFQNKDIHLIHTLLSPDVILRDWEHEALGVDNVMRIYENIFKSSFKIAVNINKLYCLKSLIIGEIEIKIDDNPLIRVVDIIDFTKSGKIISIKAFKG